MTIPSDLHNVVRCSMERGGVEIFLYQVPRVKTNAMKVYVTNFVYLRGYVQTLHICVKVLHEGKYIHSEGLSYVIEMCARSAMQARGAESSCLIQLVEQPIAVSRQRDSATSAHITRIARLQRTRKQRGQCLEN